MKSRASLPLYTKSSAKPGLVFSGSQQLRRRRKQSRAFVKVRLLLQRHGKVIYPSLTILLVVVVLSLISRSTTTTISPSVPGTTSTSTTNAAARIMQRNAAKSSISTVVSLTGLQHSINRPLMDRQDSTDPDFGGIDNSALLDHIWERHLHVDPWASQGEVVEYDRHEDYFSYHQDVDDDANFKIYERYVEDWGPHPEYDRRCQKPVWMDNNFVNCNSFHELDSITSLDDGIMKIVGNGESHYVFSVNDTNTEIFAMKTIFVDFEEGTYTHRQVEEMRKDAVVFGLFHSNDYFVDIYGYCGLSMFAEFMPHGDIDSVATPTFDAYRAHNNQWTEDQLLHMNSMEPEFKLRVALEMAESVAYLHNFEGGIIVHNDLHAVQFLFTPDGRDHWNTTNQILKISDFNMATFMKYDMHDGEYCTYHNGIGGGDWRSPEEFNGAPLNEKIDIHALGLNIFALLTGMVPFPFVGFRGAQDKFIAGEIPTIDQRIRDRSLIENRLADVMNECLKFLPADRPDINRLIDMLRGIYKEANIDLKF